ncbi:transposase [Anaerolineales bacterium HSG25]|nr:transposase [Anaerolineales bacterium HSG25]
MARKFKTVDYEEALEIKVEIKDVLPPEHLVHFVVFVISQLDLSEIYKKYSPLGAPAYAPEIMLGLLFYGYATGVFSAREIERNTKESIPFRFIAGGYEPDHSTISDFRKDNLPEIKGLFVQILVFAIGLGLLELGNISIDGSKIHADASKSKAVSYKRLLELEPKLQAEVEELFTLAEKDDSEHGLLRNYSFNLCVQHLRGVKLLGGVGRNDHRKASFALHHVSRLFHASRLVSNMCRKN